MLQLGIRVIITFLIIGFFCLPVIYIGGHALEVSMLLLSFTAMFCLRYLFYKMKFDNPNGHEHDFLQRESALELSEYRHEA